MNRSDEQSKVKTVHADDRLDLHEVIPLKSPLAIFFEPSTFCNFKCLYCTHSLAHERFVKEVRPYTNMRFDLFEKAVEQMKLFETPVKLVEFSGVGEPLFNPELDKMINKIKISGVSKHIRLITNAMLLTDEKTEAIINSGVDSIRISLQGISEESYKKITGVTINFEALFEKIKHLYLNKKNTEVFLKNVNIGLEQKEYETFYKMFADYSDRMFVENIIPFFGKVDYSQLIQKKDENRYGNELRTVDVCPNTFTALVINALGDISMCGKEIAPLYLGNLESTTLLEAWNSKERHDFLIMHLEKRRYDNSICKACEIPSESLASEKDLLDPYVDLILDRMTKSR